MSKNNRLLLALLGGAVVGTALGLIFAPEKGETIRRKIADTARDFGSRIMGTAEDLAESTSGFKNGKTRVK